MSVHQAMLISEWGPTTFYLDGKAIDVQAREDLEQRGVQIEPAPVERLAGEGHALSHIHLANGRARSLRALFISPHHYLNSAIAEQIGCEIADGPLGPMIKVDEKQMTRVPNVFAAGDITRMAHNVTFACADGVMAAMGIHRSLAFEAVA